MFISIGSLHTLRHNNCSERSWVSKTVNVFGRLWAQWEEFFRISKRKKAQPVYLSSLMRHTLSIQVLLILVWSISTNMWAVRSRFHTRDFSEGIRQLMSVVSVKSLWAEIWCELGFSFVIDFSRGLANEKCRSACVVACMKIRDCLQTGSVFCWGRTFISSYWPYYLESFLKKSLISFASGVSASIQAKSCGALQEVLPDLVRTLDLASQKAALVP